MARKTKRRPFRRPNPQQRTEDAARKQQQLRTAARDLAGSMSPEQLAREAEAREWQLTEADRAAQLDPSPETLAHYRRAREAAEAARAAIDLAQERERPTA